MRDGPKGMTCSSAATGSLRIFCETKFGNLPVWEIVGMGVQSYTRCRLVSHFKSIIFNSSLFGNLWGQGSKYFHITRTHNHGKFVFEVPRNAVQREVTRQFGIRYEPQSQEFQQSLLDYWSEAGGPNVGSICSRHFSFGQTAKVKVVTVFSALHVQKMAAAPLFLRKWHARPRGMWSILGLEQLGYVRINICWVQIVHSWVLPSRFATRSRIFRLALIKELHQT